MEEKKKGGKRAAPNRRGWLLAVLVLAGLGIWGILEWRAHTAPGPGITVNEEALTRSEPFYQYDAPGVTAYAGVDVSSYQGVVDWPAVKAAGADFAMLRVGFRGYGTGALVEDTAFAQNAADAAKAGLTVGVYFYSQAVTEEEAAEEARFVVERLRGTNVSGPIAYDLEFYTADEARTDDLTGEQATQNAIAFCDVIRQAGYEPVVYMNLHWAGSMYGMEELAHLPVWLASYGPVPALDRGVTLWQYRLSHAQIGVISAPICAFCRCSFGGFSIVSVQTYPFQSYSGSKVGQTRCIRTHSNSVSSSIAPEATARPTSTTSSLVQSSRIPLTSRAELTYD